MSRILMPGLVDPECPHPNTTPISKQLFDVKLGYQEILALRGHTTRPEVIEIIDQMQVFQKALGDLGNESLATFILDFYKKKVMSWESTASHTWIKCMHCGKHPTRPKFKSGPRRGQYSSRPVIPMYGYLGSWNSFICSKCELEHQELSKMAKYIADQDVPIELPYGPTSWPATKWVRDIRLECYECKRSYSALNSIDSHIYGTRCRVCPHCQRHACSINYPKAVSIIRADGISWDSNARMYARNTA